MVQKKTLIFTFLPIEIEELILKYHSNIIKERHKILMETSEKDIYQEIKRRVNAHPFKNSIFNYTWKRQLAQSTNIPITEDLPQLPWNENLSSINEFVNHALQLNLYNQEYIIGLNYISFTDIKNAISEYVSIISNANNLDYIDSLVIPYWNSLNDKNKNYIIKKIIFKIKSEYLITQQLVNTHFNKKTLNGIAYNTYRIYYVNHFGINKGNTVMEK